MRKQLESDGKGDGGNGCKVMVGGMAKVMQKCWKINSESDGTSNGKRDGINMGGSHGIYTKQNN